MHVPVTQAGETLMTETTWFFIAAITMALGACYFLTQLKGPTRQAENSALLQFFICLVATATYLAMAFGQGSVFMDDGRQVHISRYVTWTVTTPLLLLGLCITALGSPLRDRHGMVAGLLGADVFMILTGLMSALAYPGTPAKWVWFGLSTGAFVAIYVLLLREFREEARKTGEDSHRLYMRNAGFLTVAWFLYPVHFLLGTEAFGVYGTLATVAGYALLDILSKVVYGVFALSGTKRQQASKVERTAESRRGGLAPMPAGE
jgi:bacteriorhodopsin